MTRKPVVSKVSSTKSLSFADGKIQISEACRGLGIEVVGKNFLCPCPSHDNSKPGPCGYYGDGTNWKCQVCNVGGDAVELYLAKGEAKTKAEALQMILGTFSTGNPPPVVKAKPAAKAKAKPMTFDEAFGRVAATAKASGFPDFYKFWTYTNADGSPCVAVCRFHGKMNPEKGRPEKTLRPLFAVGDGWVTTDPNGGGKSKDRLGTKPTMIHIADPAEPVYLVEGETAFDACVKMGLNVATALGGGSSVKYADLSGLDGKRVIVWPDFEPKAAGFVADVVGIKFNPSSVAVLLPEGLPLKGDAVDFAGDDPGEAWERLREIKPVPVDEFLKPVDAPPAQSGNATQSLDHPDADYDLCGRRADDPANVAEWLAGYFIRSGRRVVLWNGELWQFNGSCYESTESGVFLPEIASHMERLYKANPVPTKKGPKKLAFTVSARLNAVECLKSLRNVMVAGARETPGFFIEDRHKPDWWPANPASVVTCRNGLLNMDTGDFLPATQDYFSVAHNDVVWNGIDTPAPRFNAWLKEVQPEAERRQQTEWLLGYTLYGDNPLSKLFYVYGGSRTGKGSTIRFMERLVGVKNSAVVCLKELGSDFGLESMVGKSLVTYPDYRAGDNGAGADLGQATQVLLSLTGRDRLNIRRKNRTTIAVKLQAKFVMGSNTVIHLPDTAGVIAKRFHGVGFKVTFADREIPDLDAQIWNEESSGILAAAVGYYRDFVANGFKFPDTEDSREMRDSVARSSSPMVVFVADCLAEGDTDDGLSFKDAFAAFIEHLRAVNARTAGWTENKFRCSLKEQNIKIPKLQTASGRVEFVAGRVLTPAGQEALERAGRDARHKENQQELTALTLEEKRRGSRSQWK